MLNDWISEQEGDYKWLELNEVFLAMHEWVAANDRFRCISVKDPLAKQTINEIVVSALSQILSHAGSMVMFRLRGCDSSAVTRFKPETLKNFKDNNEAYKIFGESIAEIWLSSHLKNKKSGTAFLPPGLHQDRNLFNSTLD